jgi:hypothetical protein
MEVLAWKVFVEENATNKTSVVDPILFLFESRSDTFNFSSGSGLFVKCAFLKLNLHPYLSREVPILRIS